MGLNRVRSKGRRVERISVMLTMRGRWDDVIVADVREVGPVRVSRAARRSRATLVAIRPRLILAEVAWPPISWPN